MTDTTHLSGYLLDYYAALAENMPNPRLVKHQRDDAYICTIRQESFHRHFVAYSPTTNPALALPIIEKMVRGFDISTNTESGEVELVVEEKNGYLLPISKHVTTYGDSLTEAALRALIAWKFPNGLPEPVYESEK